MADDSALETVYRLLIHSYGMLRASGLPIVLSLLAAGWLWRDRRRDRPAQNWLIAGVGLCALLWICLYGDHAIRNPIFDLGSVLLGLFALILLPVAGVGHLIRAGRFLPVTLIAYGLFLISLLPGLTILMAYARLFYRG